MKLRRIGVIGDVHAEAKHLATALRFLQDSAVEQIICTGDILDGAGGEDECCRLLEQHEVITVRGNHDRWLFEGARRDHPGVVQESDLEDSSLVFLQSLPITYPMETVAGRLLLCHGMGENDMQGVTANDYGYGLQVKYELHDLVRAEEFRFVVAGHTHQRMVRRFGHLTVINGATLHRSFRPCFSIVDFDSGYVEFRDLENNAVVPTGQSLKFE